MDRYQKIRSLMIDEQSRVIYDGRLGFSTTGENKHIMQMLEQID